MFWKELRNRVRFFSRRLIKPLIVLLKKLHIHPTVITLFSVPFAIACFYFFYKGMIKLGGVLFLAGSFWDMVDGELARQAGLVTKKGAFIDSTMDRFFEFMVYFGLYLSTQDSFTKVILFVLLFTSLMVSYLRARAEGLGKECSVGTFDRVIRVLFLGIGCILFPHRLKIILLIMIVGTSITVVERFFYVVGKRE